MPRTLFTKLALVLSVLMLGIGLLYLLISTSLTSYYQQAFLQDLNRDLAKNLVRERNLLHRGVLDQAALKKTFSHYMMVNPSIEIYLLDEAGKILSYSAEPGEVERTHVDMKPIQSFVSGESFPILGDDPRSLEREKIFSVTDVPAVDGSMCYLYVVLRGEEYERVERLFQESFLLRLSGVALVVSLIIGLAVGLLLFMVLTRRLRFLSGLMQQFSTGNFTRHQPYPVKSDSDEIEVLGRHYNSMAEKISEQLDDLKKQDEVRRELVANVSHDLRTPLSALHGYIETLKLKSGQFDEDTRAEYLDIALQHSRRLSRLVDELFELAKLDARETKLNCEPFSAGELIQDVIQKFQLVAEKNSITLDMQMADDLPFVYADIALIERVLENLITNALRHTPEGGFVQVRAGRHDDGVLIEISDSGEGIAQQDQAHIFDRFYRAANKQRSGYHAGLGLAIAQHIVRLHGSEISVDSEPGKGAVFSFVLYQPSALSHQPSA